jgi:hypothetical protein
MMAVGRSDPSLGNPGPEIVSALPALRGRLQEFHGLCAGTVPPLACQR